MKISKNCTDLLKDDYYIANWSTKRKQKALLSLLLAPAAGVDAASLSPHEVLSKVQSIVHRCGGGAEGAALESISVQNSSSIRLGVDCRGEGAALEAPRTARQTHRDAVIRTKRPSPTSHPTKAWQDTATQEWDKKTQWKQCFQCFHFSNWN